MPSWGSCRIDSAAVAGGAGQRIPGSLFQTEFGDRDIGAAAA